MKAHTSLLKGSGSLPALLLVVATIGLAAGAHAQQPAPKASKAAPAASKSEAAHREEDVAKHRRMARAHEEAARCLEGGEKESACHARLREACKGIAVGPYCGMRHGH